MRIAYYREPPWKAYGSAKWASPLPFQDAIAIYGDCFDCNDVCIHAHNCQIAMVWLEGAKIGREKIVAMLSGSVDMRTFDMIKGGCCPPGLTSAMLDEGPG
jgi:hypothetical protein